MNALGQAAMPRLSKYYTEQKIESFVRLLLKMIVLVIALGVLGLGASMLLGYEALKILYGTVYARESRILTLLMISATFTNVISFVNYEIMATRRFRVQLPLTLIAVILTSVWCLLLVRQLGLTGIVIGTIGSVILQSVLSIATLFYTTQTKQIRS